LILLTEHPFNYITGEKRMSKKVLFVLFVICLLSILLSPMSFGQTRPETSADPKGMKLIRPMKGWITSKFGYRTSPFTNKEEFHDGIDIAARKGTSILAALRGNVVEIGFTELGGHYVILQHSQDYRTYYGQCEKILVKKGQAVKKGDTIATCGSSGRSTGPHLHFELRKDGKPIDPEQHIEFH
jgi:murein DD-endopeptidase MepM/ murein hydrolase activator NlpD